MLIMAHPRRPRHEVNHPAQLATCRRPQQQSPKLSREDHPPDANALEACGRLVQRQQMRGGDLEVDGQVVHAPRIVELKGITVLVERMGGQRRWPAIGIDDRHHEVDGQPVLMRAVRPELAAFFVAGFAVLKDPIGVAFGERLVRVQHHAVHAAVNVRTAQHRADAAVRFEVAAADGKLPAVVEAAAHRRPVAHALGPLFAARCRKQDGGRAEHDEAPV